MLKSMKVLNFQRIKRKEIKFDPNVTVLVGENDRGKSALIRALRWITTNRPAGKAFVSHGTSKAVGILKVDNHTIKRVAGKGVNTYSLDGQVLKSFKSSVPDPIADILRINPIHFQRQNEDWFWFALSPGQVTKELNKLLDLTLLDKYQADLTRQLRDSKIKLAAINSRIEDETAEIKRLAWVADAVGGFRVAATRAAAAMGAGTGAAGVGRLLADASRAVGAAGNAVAGLSRAPKLLKLSRAVQASGTACTGLCGAVAGLESASERLNGLAGLPEPPKPPERGIIGMLAAGAAESSRVERLERQIEEQKFMLKETVGKSCPICGSTIS